MDTIRALSALPAIAIALGFLGRAMWIAREDRWNEATFWLIAAGLAGATAEALVPSA